MPSWEQQNQRINSAILDVRQFGKQVTYSRPASAGLDEVAAFQVYVSEETGGTYATPGGPLFGEIAVAASSIPLGPQKGDLIVLTNPTPKLSVGTYMVQEVDVDNEADWCRLKIRWTGL